MSKSGLLKDAALWKWAELVLEGDSAGITNRFQKETKEKWFEKCLTLGQSEYHYKGLTCSEYVDSCAGASEFKEKYVI